MVLAPQTQFRSVEAAETLVLSRSRHLVPLIATSARAQRRSGPIKTRCHASRYEGLAFGKALYRLQPALGVDKRLLSSQ